MWSWREKGSVGTGGRATDDRCPAHEAIEGSAFLACAFALLCATFAVAFEFAVELLEFAFVVRGGCGMAGGWLGGGGRCWFTCAGAEGRWCEVFLTILEGTAPCAVGTDNDDADADADDG